MVSERGALHGLVVDIGVIVIAPLRRAHLRPPPPPHLRPTSAPPPSPSSPRSAAASLPTMATMAAYAPNDTADGGHSSSDDEPMDVVCEEWQYTFEFELAFPEQLRREVSTNPLRLAEQSEADGEICKFYLKGSCMKGNDCPYKHHRGDKAVVCKHWYVIMIKRCPRCDVEAHAALAPGCAASARRATTASSCTSTTSRRCRHATSSRATVRRARWLVRRGASCC